MAIFTLETESVSAVGTAINNIATKLNEISTTINGYDTAAEDFDFASPKSVLSGNAAACATKAKNTSIYIENTVTGHTDVQNAIASAGNDDGTGKGSADSDSSGNNSDGNTSGNSNSSGNGNSSGNNSSGSSGYGGYGGSGGSGGSGGTIEGTTETPTMTIDDVIKALVTTGVLTGEIVQYLIQEIGYVSGDQEDIAKLSAETQALFNRSDFSFDENGYAKIGEHYIITCDKGYGKIGDTLKFTQTDGTEIKCVIGAVTGTDKFKTSINFFVNKNEGYKKLDALEGLPQKINKIELTGRIPDPPAQSQPEGAVTISSTEAPASSGGTAIASGNEPTTADRAAANATGLNDIAQKLSETI